eukprot:scaffold7652_cov195-Skeletonema_dohrnii-CCMP3373.AAC.3
MSRANEPLKTFSCCSRSSTHFIPHGLLQIVYLYKISNASSEMSSSYCILVPEDMLCYLI